jgi:hypothetical protein
LIEEDAIPKLDFRLSLPIAFILLLANKCREMKKLLLAIGLLTCSLWSYGQDQIILRTGDVIDASVQKIGIDEIEYYKQSNPDGPIYSVAKSEVLSIRFEDGTVEKFDAEVEPEEATEEPSAGTSSSSTATEPKQVPE